MRAEKRPAYWKAENLDGFDGLHWVQEPTRDGRSRACPTTRTRSTHWHAGDPGHDPQPAPAASTSPPATPTPSTRRRSARRRAATARGSPGARCAAATPTRASVYTPSAERERAPRGRADDGARVDLSPFRRLLLPAGDRSSPARRATRSTSRAFEDEVTPLEARTARSTQPVPPAVANRALDAGPVPAHVGARPAAQPPGADARRTSCRPSCGTCGAASAYSETPPASAHDLDGLPVRRQARLLPAVLGRDGAAAADGGRAGARGHRLHLGRARHARRASTWCATSTPTRGSRSGTRATAGSRSTRRPPPRRRARSPTRPTRAPARAPASARRASAATRRPIPAGGPLATEEGAAVGPDRARRAGRARARRRRRRCCGCAAGAARPRRPRGRGRRARARAAAHEPRSRPGHDPARARASASPAARPRPATCARCATSATAAGRAPRPRAQRRGLRLELGARRWGSAAGCARGGRCRRARALT